MSDLDAVAGLRKLLEDVGQELRERRLGTVGEKPQAGLVSDLDRRLEARLREALPTLWPGSVVVGEEEGGRPGEWTWWVDPLDGTTNCVHGWPRSAISVALYHHDQAYLGAVHDPYLGETFWAVKGQGAWLGEQRMSLAQVEGLSKALLCTGFAPQPWEQWEVCRRLHGLSRGVRVSGCASLDLAYVAAGRVQAFWEIDLQPWDVAAGLLLVGEAGGWVGEPRGGKATIHSGDFLLCAPGLEQPLLDELKALFS